MVAHDIEDLKLRGFKMFGPRLERPFDDRAYWPIWELLARHRVPLLIHFGVLGGGAAITTCPMRICSIFCTTMRGGFFVQTVRWEPGTVGHSALHVFPPFVLSLRNTVPETNLTETSSIPCRFPSRGAVAPVI